MHDHSIDTADTALWHIQAQPSIQGRLGGYLLILVIISMYAYPATSAISDHAVLMLYLPHMPLFLIIVHHSCT